MRSFAAEAMWKLINKVPITVDECAAMFYSDHTPAYTATSQAHQRFFATSHRPGATDSEAQPSTARAGRRRTMPSDSDSDSDDNTPGEKTSKARTEAHEDALVMHASLETLAAERSRIRRRAFSVGSKVSTLENAWSCVRMSTRQATKIAPFGGCSSRISSPCILFQSTLALRIWGASPPPAGSAQPVQEAHFE